MFKMRFCCHFERSEKSFLLPIISNNTFKSENIESDKSENI
jgi:hypothetical protein